ncbi:MAG: hypothetical protein HPY71_08780 [Firmicutes bacterium]|nr:hypothetical protein [Bacillota bacterium]
MNMSVKAGGLELKNPLVLASASYSANASGIEKYIRLGFSAVITKTVTRKPLAGAPPPRIFWYDPNEKRMLSGVEALRNPGYEKVCEAIARCKPLAAQEDCKIIASLSGQSEQEMAEMARALESAGADGIELNLVCPSTGPHLGPDYDRLGKYWSETPERVISVISAVKSAVNAPVWAKCTLGSIIKPEFIKEVDAKAPPDAYAFIGGRMPCLVIDTDTGKPKFPGNTLLRFEKGIPVMPTVTGPVKPSTILHTAYLAKITKTPLICSGGLGKGLDIIEALMVGASAACISTAVYRKGDISLEILREIQDFMERKGLSSLDSIKGIALQHIPDPPLLKVPGL